MADLEIFNLLTYDTVKESSLLDLPASYTNIATLVTPIRKPGLYELQFSMTYDYNSANNSVLYRWRLDGGVWYEFQQEQSDASNKVGKYYGYPLTLTVEETHTVEFEIMKESAAGTLNVDFIDLILKRVG